MCLAQGAEDRRSFFEPERFRPYRRFHLSFGEGALQTRKWTDQSGVDKYSTEVVLQGFNSNLTMLDGRSGGGSSGSDDSSGDFGAGGSSGPPRRAVAAGGRNGDMDDDIPF